MARRSYRCPNCKKQTLEFCDMGDTETRYVCPKSVNFDFGVGCARVYTVSELETLEDDEDYEEEEEEEDSDVSDCNSEVDFTDDDDYKENESQKSDEEGDPDRGLKNKNIAALLRGDLVVRRQSLIPKALSFSDGAAIARQPFKSPCSNAQEKSKEELTRRLHARKRFVPWGSQSPASVPVAILSPVSLVTKNEQAQDDRSLPPGIEQLVLWQPEDIVDGENKPIVVDPILVRFLRPHQREGVQFMFDCVAGLKDFSKVDRSLAGCILADDMGLGKTLQSITLLYTLLRQGFDGKPMAKRVIIVTPTSLVGNWESEIQKWLEGRLQVIAMCESSRADVISGITSFLSPCSPLQVMIISYETFRMHASKFEKEESCSLLICDEAHRLKNDQTITNRALANLKCNRRILLSGTPMQNDLEEFFAMVNFTNPGILGNATSFRRYYELPIIRGREPTATEEERLLGVQRSTILSEKVNQFILRRTNALLSNHLPPKIVEVVCCKLTELQLKLYRHFIESKNVKQVLQDQTKRCKVLASITALKKLCNHPKLIYDSVRGGNSEAAGFENCISLFPQEMFAGRSGSWSGGDGSWVELSGKMYVLARLLAFLYEKTDDRIVLVSNYTQTLDLFAQLCRERNYPFLRLDGTTSINKRRKLVQKFNDLSQNEFAFLLSSKAGGCGLNLIGGNRLVLFDPDWNPANDKQAAARVWRDGQKKRVYIYRFLATGTIEEKVYQRQMSKEGLQKVVQQGNEEDPKGQVNSLSMEDLRDLFTLQDSIRSEIHENLNCERCLMDASQDEQSKALESSHEAHGQDLSDIGGFAEISGLHNLKSSEKQLGSPSEEDLQSWGHHSSSLTVPDLIFQAAAGNEVSFVFTNQVDGKLVPIESRERKHLVARGIGHRTVPGAEKQVGSRVFQRQGLASESMQRKEGATHSSKPLTEFNKGIQPTRNTSQYPGVNTKPLYSNLTDRKMSKLNVSSAFQKTHVPMKRMFPDSDLSENDFCT